jgi:hypothetical protein
VGVNCARDGTLAMLALAIALVILTVEQYTRSLLSTVGDSVRSVVAPL